MSITHTCLKSFFAYFFNKKSKLFFSVKINFCFFFFEYKDVEIAGVFGGGEIECFAVRVDKNVVAVEETEA